MCDEFPTRNFQPFSMFLDLWSLETKTLSNDQHHTTADPRSLDIADFFVARALDLFSRLAVNHHRTGADDDFDLLGRRLVLHTGSIQAMKRGIPIILHAHGDNTAEWSELLTFSSARRTPPPIVLTHQTPEPIEGMHNPGGFTDGDRAVCFARALGVSRERIKLLGTRTDLVGAWSGATDPERKLVKLQWMAKGLQHLGFLV